MALRRGEARAWLPALSAPVVFLGLLVAAWALNKASLGDDSGPASSDAPLWRWLLEANNAFWGADPFSTADGARPLVATVASGAVILVLGYLGTWRATAGLRAGSSAWPAFLSTWMVLIGSSVAGAVVAWLITNRGRLGFEGAGQAEFAVLTNGLQYGVKYGWFAALLATLLWMLVRPAPGTGRSASGRLGPPEPYPREREEFFRTQARTGGYDRTGDEPREEDEQNVPAMAESAPSDGSDRLAALRAQVDAEADEESGRDQERTRTFDPYEPRPNPTPASLLDQHRQEPGPTFTRDSGYDASVRPAETYEPVSSRWGPAPGADRDDLAAPVSSYEDARTSSYEAPVPSYDEEPEPAPYVGRRARPTYDPRSDIPSAEPPYGSHRAPRDED